MANAPQNSVWSSVNYTPPRGQCNLKQGMMSGTCSCLRFMLHPVKAATSFECDGCGHHASYHSLENPADDAVLNKWASEARMSIAEAAADTAAQPQGNKRKRITNGSSASGASLQAGR